jgi:mitochondrial distribution and morphology protein 31
VQHSLPAQLAATAGSHRLLSAIIPIARASRAPRIQSLGLTARPFTRSAIGAQNATAKNTTIRRAGAEAPIAARVGLGGGLHAPWRWQGWRARYQPGGGPSSTSLIQRRLSSNAPKHDEISEAAKRASEASTQGTPTGSANKTLYERLPHLHRPTKEELLAAATGFWHRLTIHFKWFSIRSARPFNVDDIGAFLSWIFWGHVLWIVIGTTTFVSLAIWLINTVFAQETLAAWVGNYLTKSSGLKIVFESAIVPTWRDGVITFNNVFVSRRPGQTKRERSVSKGSSTTAAAAAAQAATSHIVDTAADPEEDGNYSQFDVTIQTVNVTLSFAKWFNGKGLLRDVDIKGVRGVIDRTHVHPIEGEAPRDPKSYRHTHNTGDFEIDNFKMEDVLLTIYQPHDFRPFNVSVYTCELPRLRKQWLFYDFMSANNMSGSFDNSLFTIHPRQVHSVTGANLTDGQGEDAGQFKKHTRLRIDALNIDHLNRGVEGPFSWITEGNVDIVADVMIPNDEDGSIAKVMSDFYDRMEATVTNAQASRNTSQHQDNIIRHDQIERENQQQLQGQDAVQQNHEAEENDNRFVILDIRVHLNDVRASVPLFPKDLSYVNAALVRPIVAYINTRHTFIPVSCRVVKRQSEFDGSWTIFDSGLLDDLSRETYDAFVRDIMDERVRGRRMKKVGGWALSVVAQALLIGLAGQFA